MAPPSGRPPAGQTADIAVVDIDVGMDFARPRGGIVKRIVAVDAMKLQPAPAAPFHCFFQWSAFAVSPENQYVAVGLELLECGHGKRTFASDAGVFVLDDRAVEVYCYYHSEISIG